MNTVTAWWETATCHKVFHFIDNLFDGGDNSKCTLIEFEHAARTEHNFIYPQVVP